jgi:F0F1-type ATP synthase assembly protein I
MERKPDNTRGMISFAFVIILGLVIGFLIKRVHIGLIIGLVLGLLSSGLLRRR